MTKLAPTLEAWFTERLITQRDASPRTIIAYRDTLRLLLRFVHETTGKQPSQLDFADLDATLIGAFLEHLETERGNSARTRNQRLAAIHSLYRYAALHHPEHAQVIARVIAIPTKRHDRKLISYLDLDEIKALLAAPDRETWHGRRDRALLLLAVQTGLRVSELTSLRNARHHLRRRRELPRHGQRLVFILHLLGLIGGDAGSSGASRRACGAGGRVRRAVRRAVRCVRWPCGP